MNFHFHNIRITLMLKKKNNSNVSSISKSIEKVAIFYRRSPTADKLSETFTSCLRTKDPQKKKNVKFIAPVYT